MTKYIIAITYVLQLHEIEEDLTYRTLFNFFILQDRNNLFCVIIHFLIFMKEKNSSLLDGVNLGRSGLNILGIIED